MPLIIKKSADVVNADFPEVHGALAYDATTDTVTISFKADDLTKATQPRQYTAKDGKTNTTSAFKLTASGMVDGSVMELSTNHRGTVSLKAR